MIGFETGIEKCARIYTKNSGTNIHWGDECKTDGKGNIWLPALSDDAPASVLTETRLFMGHEVSHNLHTDMESATRAVDSGGLGKKNILNALEDVRIERLWELEYTGCQEDYREFYSRYVKGDINNRLVNPIIPTIDKILNLIIVRGREKQLKFQSGLKVPKSLETLFKEKVSDLMDAIASARSMGEVEAITDILYRRFKDDKPPKPSESQDKSESGGGGSEEDSEGESEGGSKEKSNPQEPETDTENKSGNKSGSESNPSKPSNPPKDLESDSKVFVLRTSLAEDTRKGEDVKTAQNFVTERINRYAIDSGEYLVKAGVQDIIYKPQANQIDKILGVQVMERGKTELAYLGQRLRHLFISKNARRTSRYLRTGHLDSYRIMEDESDLIYKKKLRNRNKASAVGILIDCSQSMDTLVCGNDNRSSLAYRLSLGMAHYLEQIKIPLAVLGYTGESNPSWASKREVPVRISIFKEFEEKTRDVCGRFTTSITKGLTYDLDGMKVLAPMLMSRPEPKKVLFVYSDGNPYTQSRTLDNRLKYSYKKYIDRLRRHGVHVFGFGMGLNVSEYFGEDHSCTIDHMNMKTFPKVVFDKLTKVLVD